MKIYLSLLTTSFLIASCEDPKPETKTVKVPGETITEVRYTDCSGDDAKLEFCQSLKTDDKDPAKDTTKSETTQDLNLTDQKVKIEGNFTAGTIALGLTGSYLADNNSYQLYCTTFEEEPASCVTNITGSQYNFECDNFAGKTFGCFLRKDGETVTHIEFAGDSSVLAGSGSLVSNITFDENTGLARAVVDKEKSTALSDEQINKAMQALNIKKTVLSSVEGTWKVTCIDSPAEGMYCNPEDDPNFTTAVDTSKNYCRYEDTNFNPPEVIYYKCDSPGSGVEVPEGFCYDEFRWPPFEATGGNGGGCAPADPQCSNSKAGVYWDCSTQYAYCELPANAHLHECMTNKAPDKQETPPQLYLSEFTNDSDVRKISLWESKETRNACIGSGTEGNPDFGIKIANDSSSIITYSIDISSKENTENSLDDTVDSLAKSSDTDHRYIADRLIKMAQNREQWRIDQCVNSPYQDITNTTVRDGAIPCKFRLEELETNTWQDWSSGQPVQVTNTYPIHFWNMDEYNDGSFPLYLTSAPAGLTSETVECTFDATDDSGKPFCPSHAASNGTFQEHFKMDNGQKRRLLMVCKVEQIYQSYDGNTSTSYWLQQSPAASTTLAGAGGAIDLAAQASGCDTVSNPGHILDGKYEVEIDAIRRVAMEFALSKSYELDSEYLCHSVTPDSDWNFNVCDSGSSYGQAGEQLCWSRWDLENSSYLSLTKGSDGIYRDEFGSCTEYAGLPRHLCVAAGGTWVSSVVNKLIPDWAIEQFENCASIDGSGSATETALNNYKASATIANGGSLIKACQTALAGSNSSFTNLQKQIDFVRMMSMRYEWMPAKALACGAPTSTAKTKILDSIDNSCMADASLNMFCDAQGNCVDSLRCNGSRAGGKCYDEGEFAGNIPGRLGYLELKLRSGGAFELSETQADRWSQWSMTNNTEEICESSRTMVLNFQKKSDDDLKTVMKTTEKMECNEQENGNCTVEGSVDSSIKTSDDCLAASGTWEKTDTGGGMNPGGAGGTGGTAGGGPQATNFQKQTMGDMLRWLRFRKCADDACAELK